MNYYLGVDGGGSKTNAVITDETGCIAGVGSGGCGNHQTSRHDAEKSIRTAIEEAMQQAGLDASDIANAMFGLAGADREVDFRILRPMIGSLGFATYDIVCDTVIGLRAGTRQPYGVVSICGTGTNCFGVNSRGDTLQIGGFGYTYGDFGGGTGLAIEVFRTVIRAWEGRGEPTQLTETVLSALDYPSVERLFHDFLDREISIPYDLTKLLQPAADEGDACAQRILRRQGIELGKAAAAVIERLGMGSDSFDLVLVGSVLTRGSGRHILPHIENQVFPFAAGCRLQTLTMEPVAGAVILAMERNGLQPEASVYDRLGKLLGIKELSVT
ncbi:kinase [Paenibacillus marchantiophytorum]|uniref:Kinase n=1 Tax=Paenibacillus marchantiophytorum TaxID=1619310 RepID=A0ABQ1EQP5_9BACL|nr:BadF/BadG/BcrA/BcrD ATPase family protein [Paenibacillus marchantiophytorum]GFZ82830.1 kinase [Paenibacillus marchantiophytorum]